MLILILALAYGCSEGDTAGTDRSAQPRAHETALETEAPSNGEEEEPEAEPEGPQLSTLEPAEHPSTTARPSTWPCQAVRYVPSDPTQVQVRTTYHYEGPAECETPPDLHLVGCPTRAEVRNPVTDARSHDLTFRYASDGRMASFQVSSVDGERTLSTARLLYRDDTGQLARVEESYELRGARSYEWVSDQEVRVTDQDGLPGSHWIHRRDAERRPTGAERVLRSNVIGRHAFIVDDDPVPDTTVDLVTRYLTTCDDSSSTQEPTR